MATGYLMISTVSQRSPTRMKREFLGGQHLAGYLIGFHATSCTHWSRGGGVVIVLRVSSVEVGLRCRGCPWWYG